MTKEKLPLLEIKKKGFVEIPGFPFYFINKNGDVLSYYRRKDGILLRPGMTYGYKHVVLFKRTGGKKMARIHRLVLLAFAGKSHLTVNHKNGIKTDNRLENLEYMTKEDNFYHAVRNKMHPHGESHGESKLTNEAVFFIRKNKHLGSKVLSKKYNVTKECINYVIKGRTWKHLL